MTTETIVLALAALLPAAALCFYVYSKDRVEKEPIKLLFILLGLGALTAVPVLITSPVVNGIIDGIFKSLGEDVNGEIVLGPVMYDVYLLVSNVVGVACLEEGFKWLVLFFVTRNSKHFNSLFDGVIYSVFVSLGFAALENVLYAFNYGFSVAIMRAFTAVPGHMFFGVMMGTFYSMWNVKNEAGKLEAEFSKRGIISVSSPINGKKELILSYVIPVLGHGFYDFLCSQDSSQSTGLFYIFLIVLYVTQFKRIAAMSKQDTSEIGYAIGLVCKKHPAVKAIVDASIQRAAQQQSAPVAPVAPSNIRPTHSASDFEFHSVADNTVKQDFEKKTFSLYIDGTEI